jgi:putative lipoprotein (rSAM/lipoprotein system)
MAEYGTPTVNYQVKTRVVDSEGNPIKGIEVTVSEIEDFNHSWAYVLETTTQEDGTLANSLTQRWRDVNELYIKLTDIDGKENGGEFEELVQSVDVNYNNKVEQGDGSWYRGCYEVTVGDIVLEPKSVGEEESAEE